MQKKIYIFLVFLNIVSLPISANTNIYNIKTSSGLVSGTITKGIIHWDDIPYAEPPVGDLRWRAPKKFENREYLIQSKDDNFCVQESSSMGGVSSQNLIVGTEDCLYLDIKAPKNIFNEKLPVMFWIHGGGNTSGLKDIYDFSGLIKKHNVIVVSINYRLGPFGWFSHPSIQDLQTGIDKTSNFGTLDIIQALKWVNENIHYFGGDKSNITIFGESAGGHNVLSLLVAPQARGLFHKAISQSGYTTSVSVESAYKQTNKNSSFTHTSKSVVDSLINNKQFTKLEINKILKSISAEDFYIQYLSKSNLEIPLLTNDGIVIPIVGLQKALRSTDYVSKVPIIAGSNRDEVKLWIGSAKYFAEQEFSFLGKLFGIPRIKIVNRGAFDAFNYYRSSAWQLRGVIEPLYSMHSIGNYDTYAYRYDWDDHRRLIAADLKYLIGAAHATEIPLITGNNKLVGEYGFLLYPNGPSKKFTSKNMMAFWANFAKNGKPGISSNGIVWEKFSPTNSTYMILDRKKDMQLKNFSMSYKSLVEELNFDNRVNQLEKCVILYQMGSLIGNDIFDEIKLFANFDCSRKNAIKFLEANSEYIDY